MRRQPSPKKKKKKSGRKSPAGGAFIHDTAVAGGAGGAGDAAGAGDAGGEGGAGGAGGAGGGAEGAGGPGGVSAPKANISNIDMGSRLPAAEGGSGLGGELSWDPEDCGSSFGGERSSSLSTPRSASKLGEHESGGDGGGGGGGTSASAAARLASENLRLLKENEAVKAENAQLNRTIARLRMRLVASGEDEGDVEDGENVDSSRGRGRGRRAYGDRRTAFF